MSEVFGQFIEVFPHQYDGVELSFTFSSTPQGKLWGNNLLSAYFLADYFSSFLSINGDDTEQEERIKESKNTISYVGNELLENAIKFNVDPEPNSVQIGIYFGRDINKTTAVIFTKNSIKLSQVDKFQNLIQELLSNDPNELYIQQVEKAAEDENEEASGLGLLTMINDYSAKLGWKFVPNLDNPKIMMVITMAQLVV